MLPHRGAGVNTRDQVTAALADDTSNPPIFRQLAAEFQFTPLDGRPRPRRRTRTRSQPSGGSLPADTTKDGTR